VLLTAIEASLRAAELTGGLVDPTVGTALELIGYDRDFAAIDPDGPALTSVAVPVPGWQAVAVNTAASTVRLKDGVHLDLGATAKALCADRVSAMVADRLGVGVLVSLGGDVSISGTSPPGGWPVHIADDQSAATESPGPCVAIRSGGLATSSTTVRRWTRGDVPVHHLIDPATSRPAAERWRTVSVAAGSCVDANTAACAALIMGQGAATWLETMALPARLVRPDGRVTVVAGWPGEPSSLPAPATTGPAPCR
jgi:FAD:protein FMN transferase